MKIAFAGNPNSGKTTMYNAFTGKNEHVGNWAGVTVDKKEAPIKRVYTGEVTALAVDLPGAYSMSPFTSEESVTRDYILGEAPDVIINIVDATNLSRSLFFTTQLLELGIPVVVALNKSDVTDKKKTEIDTEKLSVLLGCPVLQTVALSGETVGLEALMQTALSIVGGAQKAPLSLGTAVDKKAMRALDRKRFRAVSAMVARVEKRAERSNRINVQDKMDRILTNKWLGIPIFSVVMFLVFQISQVWVGTPIADILVGALEQLQEWVGGFFENASPILRALLVDGMLGGVIAVVGFLPLVMLMYFLIALLEDCGYMARVSVVLDPIFKKVGLSGKSVIPFVITVGCAVPGIMASRTIRDERERRATAMLAPFMPCGAKIPVISLFAGAFFKNAGWVSTAMYLSGIVLIFLCALLVNKITGYKARKSFFIIELPEYKLPSLWNAVKSMCSRGWSYIVKATTIILLCNTVVQVMQSFTWSFAPANETASDSILATVASPFAYLLVPVVGVLSWQLAAAAVTGFIAKENVVGTLAVCFGISRLIDMEELMVLEGVGGEIATVFGITKAAALAYLTFNLFSPPCFAAIGAMRSEMKSGKWMLGGVALQLSVGFTVGFSIYQIGTLLTSGHLGAGFLPGVLAVIAMAGVCAWLILRAEEKKKAYLKEKAAKKAAGAVR